MAGKQSKIEIILSAKDQGLSSSLQKAIGQVGTYQKRISDLGAEVKRLGLMTESAFSRKNMEALDVKPVAEVRAEMARLTRAYLDLKASGKASASELSQALDNLRAKNKALVESMSKPTKLASARSLLGVKSSADIAAELRSLQSAYLTIKNSGVASAREIAVAQEALRKKTRELAGEQQALGKSFTAGLVGKAGGALLGLLAAREVAGYANEIRKIADEYVNLNSRLKLVTDGEQDLITVRQRLYDISQETGTEFSSNADSYAKLARAVKDLGGDSQATLQIVEMVNKSLTINGSSAAMSSAFMLQFAQAMGSGVLQGDEFRSMLENNGYFAAQLAKALDTNIAGLRKMSKDGALTADVLRKAFPEMAEAINGEFAKITPTVGRAVVMLQNAFKSVVDESNQASGGTGKISTSIINLAHTIENNKSSIISLFSFITDMAAGATDKVLKLVGAVGNIIQSGAGWKAVANGDLSFFEFATMDAEELHQWLEKNKKSLKEVGDAGEKAGDQVADGAKSSAAAMSQVSEKAIEAMKKKYQDYAKEVQRLNGEISGRTRSLYAELREMARSGMSDYSAWKDQKSEAKEYAKAARQAASEAKSAMSAGDDITAAEKWKEALQYAEDSKAAYKALNTEVKSSEQVVVSQQQALKAAMDGVKESGKLGIEILKEQREATKSAMDELQAKGSFDALTEGMDNAEKQWLKNWQTMADDTMDKIDKIDARLDELANKKRTAKLVIDYEDGTRQTYRTGGPIGAYRTGGLISNIEKIINMQRLATGGGVRNILSGGRLAGYGGGDRRLLLGEDGEFMIRKEAVSRYGSALFHALNNLNLPDPSKFAVGGPVGFAAGGQAAAAASPSFNASFDFRDQTGHVGRVYGSEIDVKALEKAVNKHNRYRSSNR